MTPEQKAYLLVSKFKTYCENRKTIMGKDYNAKQCALICVDQIVQNSSLKLSDTFIDFWYQVKQEINKR